MRTYSLLFLSLSVIQCCLLATVKGQIFSGYACLDSFISLSCNNNKNISITEAFYGQYDPICPDPGTQCCAPQNDDCREDVEQVEPDDMVDLRAACDGKASCDDYRVLGGSLYSCPGLQQAQYMEVFHRCLPEDPTTVPPTPESTSTTPTTTLPPSTTTGRPPFIPTTSPPEDDQGLSGGVIAAIVIAVILAIAIAVVLGVIIWRKLHPPPKPKKVVRRRTGKKSTVVYDNQAFASSNQVVVHLDQDSKTIPNGVHNNNKKDTGPAPVSDGKRKAKPVTAAESFRYAQEKEALAQKYRTDGNKSQSKKKSLANGQSGNNLSSSVAEPIKSGHDLYGNAS